MEELQNLKSDSEALEKQIPAPYLLNTIKILCKFSVGVITLVGMASGVDCGSQMNDVIAGTGIALSFEACILLMFLIVKYKSKSCVKTAGSLMVCSIGFDLIEDFFYIGWGIYVTIIYFNENDCGYNMNFSDIIGLIDVIYFLIALSLMVCVFGAKLCMCLSTLTASAKSGIDRSLSHDLVEVRRESFVEN